MGFLAKSVRPMQGCRDKSIYEPDRIVGGYLGIKGCKNDLMLVAACYILHVLKIDQDFFLNHFVCMFVKGGRFFYRLLLGVMLKKQLGSCYRINNLHNRSTQPTS